MVVGDFNDLQAALPVFAEDIVRGLAVGNNRSWLELFHHLGQPFSEILPIRFVAQGSVTGWRLHDLRHAFASMMVNSGASLPIIGKILGHSQASTTQRYAHLEQNPARKAAEGAAAKIAKALKTAHQKGKVIPFPKAQD